MKLLLLLMMATFPFLFYSLALSFYLSFFLNTNILSWSIRSKRSPNSLDGSHQAKKGKTESPKQIILFSEIAFIPHQLL